MPSYIELDKQASFPSASNAGKVIFGVDNSGQVTVTTNTGQTTPVGGGGSIDTGSFITTGSNSFTGNQTISGSIIFGDGSQIQSVSQSSGDGYGFTTLELKPDASLGTDQYIVLDPTTNNHIHIRAGGTIDSSSAYLYLGGENNNVLIDDSVQRVQIVSVNAASIIGALEQGSNVIATGIYTHAQGGNTQAKGAYSHAEGANSVASGSTTHAEGSGTTAYGEASHTEGVGTTALGAGAHAEGESTQAIGNTSHTEGSSTKTGTQNAYYAQSISSGIITLSGSYGDVSSSFGANNILYLYDQPFDDLYSRTTFTISQSYFDSTNTIVELYDNSVNTSIAYVGNVSQYVGDWTGDQIIPGDYSHAEGQNTYAVGNYSHAEGQNTQAIGNQSHAEGQNTRAIGLRSHAEGQDTTAIGAYSHTEGQSTISSATFQHVQGKFNATSSIESAFIVGNGFDNENRSNLIHAGGSTVEITGSLQVSGSITLNNASGDLRPYKVFTANLFQTGSSNNISITNENLIIGTTYFINNTDNDTVDFTNVGAPNNNINTYFIATGTTPNSWGENTSGELRYNTGTPVATVLENTIGDVWLEYETTGRYNLMSTNLFTEGKTTSIIATPISNQSATTPYFGTTLRTSDSTIRIYTLARIGILENNSLYDTLFEVRVYN